MGIKSTATTKGTSKPKYPYLGITQSGGKIILMVSPRKGVVVGSGSGHDPVGYISDAWLEDSLEVYSGTVTLENA